MRLIAGLAVALVVLAACPGTASAHAFLVRAEPGAGGLVATAPRAIRLWFSEPIDLPPLPVQVFGPDGRRVRVSTVAIAPDDATEMIAQVPGLRRGTYTVLWKVISADTHPVWGEFTFSIGAPSAVVAPIAHAPALFQAAALAAQALARLLTILGLVLLVGPLGLWVVILAPAVRAESPALVLPIWRRIMRFYDGAVLVLAVATPLALAAQMMGVSDSPASALSLDAFVAAWRGRLGWLLALRLVLVLALFVAGATILYLGPGRLTPTHRHLAGRAAHPLLVAPAVLAALLTLSISLGGHAGVTSPVALSLPLDMLHLVATALWVGGMCALVGALGPALRSLAGEQRDRLLAAVIPPFSALALGCVTTLTLTGLYSAVRNLGSPADLVSTGYGRVLGVKVLVGLAVVPAAAVNLLVLRPLLGRVAGGRARRSDLWPPLRALLCMEMLLAAVILVAAGLLTALPPARLPDQNAAPARLAQCHARSCYGKVVEDTHPRRVRLSSAGRYAQRLRAPAPSPLVPHERIALEESRRWPQPLHRPPRFRPRLRASSAAIGP